MFPPNLFLFTLWLGDVSCCSSSSYACQLSLTTKNIVLPVLPFPPLPVFRFGSVPAWLPLPTQQEWFVVATSKVRFSDSDISLASKPLVWVLWGRGGVDYSVLSCLCLHQAAPFFFKREDVYFIWFLFVIKCFLSTWNFLCFQSFLVASLWDGNPII